MPSWNSKGEKECRARVEDLKARYCKSSAAVPHPCLRIREENLAIARANIRRHDWAKAQWDTMLALADHYASRSSAWIETMVPELTPLHVYGTFCPVCKADNTYRMKWDYRDPERLVCFHCGADMADQTFQETGRLHLPRSGQTLTYYIRPEECGDAEFATGRNAFAWAGRKIHSSYMGAIRQHKTNHMTGVARTLAVAYRMTGEDRYARAAAAILVRFAAVYPGYLLHDYWNTYMDCDPLYACELMAQDRDVGRYEVNACPDQPARSGMKSGKLIQTFWGCGRLHCGGVMGDATHITHLAETLDLLWDATDGDGQPLLTASQRDAAVRDLVVEGLLTFTHWEGINNKVAGCRVGEVALGRFLGAPEYVHRGVEGFAPYLEGFFDFDGSTAEGSSYYLYAVSNVRDLPEAARGYSDPPSYRRKDRYDDLDLYDPEGVYRTVLRARMLMTLPGGRLPHAADAIEGQSGWPAPRWLHETGLTRLGREFAPFVDLDTGDEFSLFTRPTGTRPNSPPAVRDRFFPGWMLAILNTGYDRMFQQDLHNTASLVMSFYKPVGHSHPDALNIAMVSEGVEVLSDLGYIGDDPLNASIRSTLKHNLVVIDRQQQLPPGKRPPGSVRQLAVSPGVKVIEADCDAYEQAEEYRRCCVMVNRGNGPAYVVDCFRVRGGRTHDYAIHGEGRLVGMAASESTPLSFARKRGVIDNDIGKLQVATAPPSPWAAAWCNEGMTMRVHALSGVDSVTVGEGPGQRLKEEIGVRKDYLFASCGESGAGNTFVTLIDHFRSSPDIREVRLLSSTQDSHGPVAVQVERSTGRDIVLLGSVCEELSIGGVRFRGHSSVYSESRGGGRSLFLAGCQSFQSDGISVDLKAPVLQGRIQSSDRESFVSDVPVPNPAALRGHFVQVEDPARGGWTAYAIRSVRGRRIRVDEFPFNSGTRYRIPSVLSLELSRSGELDIRTNVNAAVSLPSGSHVSEFTVNGRAQAAPEGQTPGRRTVLRVVG